LFIRNADITSLYASKFKKMNKKDIFIFLLLITSSFFGRAQQISLKSYNDTCNFCKELSKNYPFTSKEENQSYKTICCKSETISIIDPDNLKINRKDVIAFDKFSNKQYHTFTKSKKKTVIMDYSTSLVDKGIIVDVDILEKTEFEFIYTLKIDTSSQIKDNKIILTNNTLVKMSIYEELPTYPGGDNALKKLYFSNLKIPAATRENGIDGIVNTSFVVEEDGSISNIRTIKGIGYGCDEEAIRIIKIMPRWNPGKINGKPIRVAINIPTQFQIDGF